MPHPTLPLKTLRAIAACLISATTAALLTACGGGSDAPSAETPFQAREIAVVPLTGVDGSWPAQNYVARTPSEWNKVWNLRDATPSPAPEIPAVDFSANTIAGVSLGWGGTPCTPLEISRVTEEAEQIRIEYRQAVQPPEIGCIQMTVPLVAFVKLPATAKPIVFEQAGGSPVATTSGAGAFAYDGPATGGLPPAFVAAKQAWLASGIDDSGITDSLVADYRFDVQQLCFCGTSRMRVFVKAGRTMFAGYAPDEGPDEHRKPGLVPTMTQIFDTVEAAFRSNAARVQFTANAPHGDISRVHIDYVKEMQDEEQGFAITNFQVHAPLPLPQPEGCSNPLASCVPPPPHCSNAGLLFR